jgi:hypothetical protein
MRYFFILLFLSATTGTFAQTKSDTEVNKTLKGIWVKTTKSPDTLKFSMIKDLDNYFELILFNGPKPPKRPGGLYEYRTLKMVMMIHWVPSSNSFDCPTVKYYFDKDGQLCIDNFYSADNEDKILTFKKIK